MFRFSAERIKPLQHNDSATTGSRGLRPDPILFWLPLIRYRVKDTPDHIHETLMGEEDWVGA